MTKEIVKRPNSWLDSISSAGSVSYLTEDELNRLTQSFENWLNARQSKLRYRYWLTFLFLRFTGARISELLAVDDKRDIDIRNAEIKMPILKRKKTLYKTIPIPDKLIAEYLRVIKLYPDLEGRIFKIDRSNFYRCFRERCKEAGIPEDLAHPHILRHTRAVEMVRAGVPLTAVQKLLGHYSLSNTAVYLQFSGQEVKAILKTKNLI